MKRALESRIRELEERLVGVNLQQTMEAQQEKMQAYREFQLKLKQQKQRERELLESRLR